MTFASHRRLLIATNIDDRREMVVIVAILLVIESERGADRFAALDQFLLIDL